MCVDNISMHNQNAMPQYSYMTDYMLINYDTHFNQYLYHALPSSKYIQRVYKKGDGFIMPTTIMFVRCN